MSELPYTLTFNELTQPPQRKEFHELLQKSKQLMDAAHHEHDLPKISRNPHLRRFIDTPGHVQAFWEIEKHDATYPRDRLAINMGHDALWISMSYSDLQPNRSLTIGNWYARLDEQNPLRAQSSERILRNDHDEKYFYNPGYVAEHLAQFALQLDDSIELIGLRYAVPREVTEEVIQEAA